VRGRRPVGTVADAGLQQRRLPRLSGSAAPPLRPTMRHCRRWGVTRRWMSMKRPRDRPVIPHGTAACVVAATSAVVVWAAAVAVERRLQPCSTVGLRRALRRVARRAAVTAVEARLCFLGAAQAVVFWRRPGRVPPHRCSGCTRGSCTPTPCVLPMACRGCLLQAPGQRTGCASWRRPRRALASATRPRLFLPPLLTLRRPFTGGERRGSAASMKGW